VVLTLEKSMFHIPTSQTLLVESRSKQDRSPLQRAPRLSVGFNETLDVNERHIPYRAPFDSGDKTW
jgi:hypothetical protein